MICNRENVFSICLILPNKYHGEGNIQSKFAKESASNFVKKYFIGFKVKIFWEGHNFFSNLPLFFDIMYLVVANHKWKMGHIFVDFSEYKTFTSIQSYEIHSFA